jgi:hypothetical protein
MNSDSFDSRNIFVCQQCGQCCNGYGGTYVTEDDIQHISAYIHTDVTSFIQTYCRISGGKPLLVQAENGFCVFYDQNCSIHPVKPLMCRAWPFIPGVLKDPSNWFAMANSCPGMNRDVSTETVLACVTAEINKLNR